MSTKSPYIDELSGVYNRNYLKVIQEQEIKKLIQNQTPFSVVMVDIDHFKDVNDVHGHMKGDEVIKEFAQFIKDELRTSDTVIRYGGDEFICIMPRTTHHDAGSIYQRIIRRCKETTFGGLTITLSAGIASRPDDAQDFKQLLKVADDALYDAKRSGRARIGLVRKKRIELPIKAFVNRLKEKQQLKALFVDHEKGIKVMVVKGQVGIGKTRLVKEILSDMRSKEIVWSDCLSFAENIAYYPIREAIKYRIHRIGIEMVNNIPLVYRLELAKLVPEIAENIENEPAGFEAVADKYRLYESIRKVFATKVHELVIVIDNTQWIDHESIEVMKFLLRSLGDMKLVCVFIYRTEEIPDFMEDFLTFISREVSTTDIALDAFGRTDIKESIKAIIGEEPSSELVEYLVHESGGIPFYIEEIMRALLDQRFLAVEEDQWILHKPDKEVVPKTLEDVMLRKYRSLSKEAQEVLNIASVIGWFDIDIIKMITDYNEGEILGLITDIYRVALAKYTKDRYIFAEEISRSAIYRSFIKGAQKIILHRKVAEKIAERFRDREMAVIDELAFHYYNAGDAEKGVHYCLQAGDHAHDEYANQSAIRYYTWALKLLSEEKEGEQIDKCITCLQKRSRVYTFVGDYDGALHDLKQSLPLARSTDDKKREAAALSLLSYTYFRMGELSQSIQNAQRCKEIAEKIGDKDFLGEALNGIGNVHSMSGRHKEAMGFYKQARVVFQELGNKLGELNVRNNLGNVYEGLGDYERALAYFQQGVKIAEEIGYKAHLGGYYSNIGWVNQRLGQFDTAEKFFNEALDIARETGDTLVEARSYGDLGALHADLGDYETALDFHAKALRIARKIGTRDNEAIHLSNLAAVYVAMGKYRTALSYYEDGLRIGQETGQEYSTANALSNIAQVYMYLGDFDEASAIARELHSHQMSFSALLLRGELLLEQNRLAECNSALDDVEQLQAKVKSTTYEASVNLLFGRYYVAAEEFVKAGKYLKNALQLFEDCQEKISIGTVLYYLGTLEHARENPSACRRYLTRAAKVFTELRATSWQHKAEQLLARCTSKS